MQKRREREREREREKRNFYVGELETKKRVETPQKKGLGFISGYNPFFFSNGSVGDLKKLELERKALNYFRAKKKKKNPLSLPKAQTTTEILYKTPCQKRVVSLEEEEEQYSSRPPPGGERASRRTHTSSRFCFFNFIFWGDT